MENTLKTHILDQASNGEVRACKKVGNNWVNNANVREGILAKIKSDESQLSGGGYPWSRSFDKFRSKFELWKHEDYKAINLRVSHGAIVREGAYIGRNCIIMPSFVNVGAYIDDGTVIDSFVTVGSCAQIGKRCHISEGVGIGGVLEPIQATPVIIEDDCFIGAGSRISEGVIIREGAVLGMNVAISQSTKIVDRETGKITYGEVPAYSVVVSGSLPSKGGVNLYCAVIVKQVDAQTRSKTSINELLRG